MTFTSKVWHNRGGIESKKMASFFPRKSGTIIEVNVSELGLVTQTGKVIFAKYAQVTNNPDPWMQSLSKLMFLILRVI